MSDVVVVGAGPSAHRLVERLRHHGFVGTLTLLGSTPDGRPPSPFGARDTEDADGTGPPSPFTVRGRVAGVRRIDRVRRRVLAYAAGTETAYPYDVLVLATPARPLIPDVAGLVGVDGGPAEGVVAPGPAATVAGATGDTVVVLGDGPSAVETASALTARGTATTLVCTTPHPLHGQLGATCSAMLAEELERAGITVVGGATVVGRSAGRLRLADGTTLRADPLVLAAGTTPDTALARRARLDVHTGIVVDDRLRTSDPLIHAFGDGTEHDGHVVDNPVDTWEQAEVLAEILTGRTARYLPRPRALRLRTDLVDVATIGSPAELRRPGTRLVGLTDRPRRRYARLALRDGHVVAAVLLGLPQAIATIGFLHRRGQPLPSDRLGLLLGLPPRPASDGAPADEDGPVCLCNDVRERTLLRAWRAGSRTVAALAEATRATTGCGGCGRAVAELCGVWERAS
ncbi:FAD-dependent oxidoreductase [Micromonospora humida]|uniref:FAD-dependent oxidoreductase n=1 Tax=Micromonospora humida TaxID=2809018 RepID=A0ABS2IWY9_9ACTN|nr:FAD-dependent oxidoreductase [Micromonospora humida]MBM7078793.1 FAD-dependent oxidoreductase [Micromonospora humida]